MSRRSLLPLTFVVAAIFAGACATRQPIEGRKHTGLDTKLSTFAYIEEGRIATLIVDTRATRDRDGEPYMPIEEGRIATLIVDTRATRDRDGEPYMPLEIAVANTGLRQLALTRESFTLVDEEGNRYPMAGPRELLEGYEHLEFDRNLAELPGIVFNKFAAYRQYPSNFSPTPASGTIVRDLVSLPKFGYFFDWIYFPTPPGGIRGHRFELFMDSQHLEDPIFVKFEVR